MERGVFSTSQYVAPKIASSRRAASRMERLGKPRHGREGWRLSEPEVSESHPVKLPVGRDAGFLRCTRNHDCLFRKFAA